MTDELSPQQTDAVRRALRAARHDAPLPPEIAARLDATLADLVAERSAPGVAALAAVEPAPAADAGEDAASTEVAPVVPLRRRRWPAYLAAAAAVTAIGLAGTQLVDRGGDSAGYSTADEAGQAEQAPSALSERPDDTGATLDGPEVLGQLNAPVRLGAAERAALADAGYRRLQLVPELASTADSERSAAKTLRSPTPAPAPGTDAKALAASCSLPDLDLPTGVVPTYYLARHAGEQVVLVVLPGPEVTAYPCAGGAPTRLPLD